jgi:pimeloyl-ACP methyl ester carboxylesterase
MMVGKVVAMALVGAGLVGAVCVARDGSDDDFRDYTGVYRWRPDGFVYMQRWSELTAANQLVAFDESGDVRALFPNGRDHFVAGGSAGIAKPVEATIAFQRDSSGKIVSFTSTHGAAQRVAQRLDVERRDEVQFSNGNVRLAGTLISPRTAGPHPAIILVHASGAEDRDYVLPLAHFLVRRGIALLGYDKRGVGGSSGDWRTASFEDLASDVVAAFNYLKTRQDIDSTQIGLFGWSQAGWVMPLAAERAKEIAFMISISGAAVPPAVSNIDQARNEMTANGMKPETVKQIVDLMQLQYDYARTGHGWDDYANARRALVARLGQAPPTFPATPDDAQWTFFRRVYLYDPARTLRQLRVPTLAVFGELDDNIIASKNKPLWDEYLRAAGNPDYTLIVHPRANHLQLEAKTGTNPEMPTLQRFVPPYFTTIRTWLAKRVRGFDASP